MSVRILVGDCRERMKELPDASVDSCVCDPPYHLTSIVKRFGSATAAPAKVGKTGAFARVSKGFMGQTWDGGDVAFQPETWAEVLRVLKPGGHLVAFSGTRTYHRMAVAIEDAGFEIRDQLAWVYGAGFPKSHNIDKKIGDGERCNCVRSSALSERELRLVRDADLSSAECVEEERGQVLLSGLSEQGSSGAVLRPESEEGAAPSPKPLLEGRDYAQEAEGQLQGRPLREGSGMGFADGPEGPLHHGASASDGANVRLPDDADGSGQPQGSQPGEQSPVELGALADERRSQAGGTWPICGGCGKPNIPTGYGSALKPAYEPIVLARKPLQGTILSNFLAHGTGALNIDGCRIEAPGEVISNHGHSLESGQSKAVYGDFAGIEPHQKPGQALGRWPANLCHDGSDEVLAGFPETGAAKSGGRSTGRNFGQQYEDAFAKDRERTGHDDEGGSAARFFYCAKATTEERGEGNTHPTVKPIALMRWLVRLITPPGGTVLDPFMGSGSTLIAADAEQFNAIGCEMSPEYAAIAERRIRDAVGMFAEVKAA